MKNHQTTRKPGLTLAELLVASAVMGILCVGFGTLAVSVQMANTFAQERNQVGQHARVILLRIENAIQKAHATEAFPGFLPITYDDGSYDFPQAIAIWNPSGIPTNDYPLVNQLTFFACDPAAPNRLLEITNPSLTTVAPALNAPSDWRNLVQRLIDDTNSDMVEITDLLRAGKLGSNFYSTLRFKSRITPTATELAEARAGTVSWESLNWPTSIYSSQSGLRQAWCAFEFQLVPSSDIATHATFKDESSPFFGSSALYYQVTR
ncbi:type II secretion system protein [Bremerella cremea]|uniref:Type II secretion system protein n=1 Tax=Bremerella cremea TaxID=1031537 RepID=A0A368KLN5_9BACT|nr:type II secretion system protein [Bremerella cremea]RCS42089.1 type II secretion system protein [Bremerella cremea]